VGARLRLGLALAGLVFVLDRLSKAYLIELLAEARRGIEVLPFFNLVQVWNRGVSFGLLASHEDWAPYLLAGFAAAVSVALIVWLARAENAIVAAALGLVIGGALSNALDRLLYGAVADFFDFHALGWHWPAFNVADMAVVGGVGGLLGDSLFRPREGTK
jgi:signal peptidase II